MYLDFKPMTHEGKGRGDKQTFTCSGFCNLCLACHLARASIAKFADM